MRNDQILDILWLMVCAALVLTMQGGFCFLESGLVRAKNSINVAFKNIIDLCLSGAMFWLVGYGLMFGASAGGFIGADRFALIGQTTAWALAFFLFQLVFCSTATTIVSGAVSERMRFKGYLVVVVLISTLIYPLFGHWAWNGADVGEARGWLARHGFIDFAGSTVVHSVGGWVGLAAVIVIGPRLGRFEPGASRIHGHNLPMAVFGVMLLWFGWFGFNGGSTLALTDQIPLILVNTNIAAVCGGAATLGLSWLLFRRPDVGYVINGSIAGLVGITASCHLMTPFTSALVGVSSAAVCLFGTLLLERLKIDDGVAAVPAHAFAGAWGTLGVALLAPSGAWGDELTRWEQLLVQAQGVGACFALAFGGGFVLLWCVNRVMPLRVSAEHEQIGLNVAEHGASTELHDLLNDMDTHRRSGDFSERVRVEPHTEVGQIATEYNRVLDKVTDEMRQREATAEALRLTQFSVDHASDCIFWVNPEGRFIFVNDAAQALYGYSREALLRMGVCDISERLTTAEDWQAYWERVKEAGAMVVETMHVDHAGREFPVEMAATYLQYDGREYLFAYGREISERKRQQEMAKEKEAAEAASRAKSQFLANMSHEIRTPLNGVIGMIDLLMATEMDAKQQRYARIAKSSADSLLSLINDILDFSKIEAGKLELDHVPFDLGLVVEDALEMFAQRAAAKGLELFSHLQPDTPVHVVGDPDRLRQVLINLINNAIKFTEEGEIVLRTELVRREESGEVLLRFEVSDNGIGIPEERRHRLFRPFSQVDGSTTRRFGGTGLGLAICKQLVELMGGEIDVDSSVGRGSRFWFTARLGHAPAQAGSALPDDLRGLRVLVVDDNATNREILHEQLTSWGFEVRCAAGAEEAMAVLGADEPYRLAIIDMQMPEVDGLGLVQRMKREERCQHTLVLILSSIGDQIGRDEMRSLGVAGLLTKPVRQSRLYDAIIDAVAARPRSQSSVVERQAPSWLDFKPRRMLRVLLAEDNDVNQVVAAELLRKLGIDCEVAPNGRDAVDALRNGGFDLVLMDCQMPELDGFEATRQIRDDEAAGRIKPAAGGRTPIIALTANAIKGDREKCLDAGMDGYITKPIDPKALVDAIAELVPDAAADAGDETTAQATSADAASATPSTDPAPMHAPEMTGLIDVNDLLTRCLDDQAFAATVLDQFAGSVAGMIEEIRAAVEASDLERAARQAHTLKGASANVAAPGIAALAADLERAARDADGEEVARRLADVAQNVEACLEEIPRVGARLGEAQQRR